MRRDYFSLEVDQVDWLDGDGDPDQPLANVHFDGPASRLRSRLTGTDNEPLDAAETDVTFRLQDPLDDPEAAGVVALTSRVTGEFVLECNADADTVMRFIRAARRYGEEVGDADSRYRIRVLIDDDEVAAYEKRTFLVYNDAGNLLRKHSLIPSGVEL